jgi:hypothetical protein
VKLYLDPSLNRFDQRRRMGTMEAVEMIGMKKGEETGGRGRRGKGN